MIDRENDSVHVSDPRPTSHLSLRDYPGAVDVDVTIRRPDGQIWEGEVTVTPSHYDGVLCLGSPEERVSGALLRRLCSLSDKELRDMLDKIEEIARAMVA